MKVNLVCLFNIYLIVGIKYKVNQTQESVGAKNIVSKLYVDAVVKSEKMRSYVSPDIEYEKSKNELTFKPKIGHV